MALDDEDDVNDWKTWLQKHGPWAALTLLLLSFYLYKLDPVITSLQAEHREMRAEEAEEALQIKNVYGQVLMSLERSNYLERRNCINTARTPAERDACAKDRD